MPTDIEKIQLQLSVTQRRFENQLKNAANTADKKLKGMERRFDTLNKRGSRGFSKLGGSARASFAGMLGPAAGVATAITLVGAAVVAAAKTGERLMIVEKRLEAITGSSERAKASLEAIKQVAQLTGTGIDTVAGAFARYTLAAQEIGATTSEVETLTQTILQLGVIGGGTQSELSSGAQQLAQSLAKGVLNGDELRSVMENMPLVAKQIADGLGVGIGRLKEMGAAGELTSSQVFDALLRGSDAANKKFGKLPLTIERASTRMTNAFHIFLAKINETTGASRVLAGVINNIANELDRLNLGGDALKVQVRKERISDRDAQIKAVEDEVTIAREAAEKQPNNLFLKGRGDRIYLDNAQKLKKLREENKLDLASIKELEGRILDKKDAQHDIEKAKGIVLGREKATKAEIAALQKIEDERAFNALTKRNQAIAKARKDAQDTFKTNTLGATKAQITNVGNAAADMAGDKFDTNRSRTSKAQKPAKELSEFFANIEAKAQSIRDEIDLLGLSEKAIVKLKAKHDLLSAAKKKGIDLDARSLETGRTVREEIDAHAESVAQLSEELAQGKINEERFATAIDGIADAFTGALVAGESLRDGLRNVFQSIASDIVSSNIKGMLNGLFDDIGGGSKGGGILSAIFSGIIGGIGGGGGRVSTARVSGPMASSAIPRMRPFATGGPVFGAGGPRDDKIAALLSNGEYVINAQATSENRALLDAINSGGFSIPKFANGGPVGGGMGGVGALQGGPTEITQSFHIEVNNPDKDFDPSTIVENLMPAVEEKTISVFKDLQRRGRA